MSSLLAAPTVLRVVDELYVMKIGAQSLPRRIIVHGFGLSAHTGYGVCVIVSIIAQKFSSGVSSCT